MLLSMNFLKKFAVKSESQVRPWYRKFKFLKKAGLECIYKLMHKEPGLVINGGLKLRPYNRHFKHVFLKELWDNDYDYLKTQRYKEFSDKIAAGQEINMPVKGYRIKTQKELESYFLDYIKLLKSMKEYGYLEEKGKDDLLVIIGPQGELIKTSKGRHRLAAAQITGIKSIPVK